MLVEEWFFLIKEVFKEQNKKTLGQREKERRRSEEKFQGVLGKVEE